MTGIRITMPRVRRPRLADGFTVLTPRLHTIMSKARHDIPPAEQHRERHIREKIGACYACAAPFAVGSVFAKSRRRYRWYCPPCAMTHRIVPYPLAAPPVPLACRR